MVATPCVLGLVQDGLAGAAVQVDDHQRGDAAGDHLVGDGLEGVLVVLRVLDVVVDAGGLERLFEVLPVGGLPAGRRLAVGQDDADLRLLVAEPPLSPSSPHAVRPVTASSPAAARAMIPLRMNRSFHSGGGTDDD